MLRIIKKIWVIIPKDKKKSFLKIIFLAIFSALVEILTILSFGLFLSLLLNPRISDKIPFINQNLIHTISNTFDKDLIIIIFTLLITLIILISFILKYFLFKKSVLVCYHTGTYLSIKVFEKLIKLNYLDFRKLSSSYLVENLLNQSNALITCVFNPFLIIIINSILLILIILFFLILDFRLIYLIIFLLSLIISIKKINNKLNKNTNNDASIKAKRVINFLVDVFNGIKDIKLYNLYVIKIKEFREKLNFLNNQKSKNTINSISPKFILECFGMILLILFSAALVVIQDNNEKAIPLIGMIAFSVQKGLPIFQQCVIAYLTINKNISSLTFYYNNIPISNNNYKINDHNLITNFESLEIKNLFFSYTHDNEILSNVNIKFNKGDKVAIVGESGSGKSTFIEILSSLIIPDNTQIFLNSSSNIFSDTSLFNNNIAYVPQKISLFNASILENIVIDGSKDINFSELDKILKITFLDKFISSLDDGFDQIIGENGIDISGGQIQRIGIARALYLNRKILLLDEALNGIDQIMQRNILFNIFNHYSNLTVIFNTHNLYLLNLFDKVYKISSGRLNLIVDNTNK